MFFSLPKEAREKGNQGEAMALRYFRKNRFKVLEKNWRTRRGEIDLIVEKQETLYFVEVKFRRGSAFGRGEESIHASKQRKLVLAALDYLQKKKIREKDVRFAGLIIDGAASPAELVWLEFPLDLPAQYY